MTAVISTCLIIKNLDYYKTPLKTVFSPRLVSNLEFIMGGIGSLRGIDPEDISQAAGH